jgi:hypothetical protein
MAKYVVMEVYSVEAADVEAAKAAVGGETNKDGVFLVGESLGQLMNPFHWADAQNKFGHIAPVPVVADLTPPPAPVDPAAPVAPVTDTPKV